MTQADHATKWYVAQLKPNAHQIARDNLEKQGFRTFLPLHADTIRRNNRFQTILKPLFPGYIFIGVDRDDGAFRSVNATRGVTKLISTGNTPTAVPSDIMAAFQQRFGNDGIDAESETVQGGDRVRLASGPFTDLIAEVETVHAEQRIWLLLEVMGRKTRISTRPKDVRRTQS